MWVLPSATAGFPGTPAFLGMSQSLPFPSLLTWRPVSRLTAAHSESSLQFAKQCTGQELAVHSRRRIGIGGSPVAPAPHQDVCWKSWLLRHTLCPRALPTAQWPDWPFSTGEFPNWITISRKTEPTLSAQEARSHHVYVHVC